MGPGQAESVVDKKKKTPRTIRSTNPEWVFQSSQRMYLKVAPARVSMPEIASKSCTWQGSKVARDCILKLHLVGIRISRITLLHYSAALLCRITMPHYSAALRCRITVPHSTSCT